MVVLRIVPADRWRAGGGAVARFAGLVFAGGLLGGLVPGTLRDFLGEPQPRTLYYFDGPRPESQWFWRPLLAEWLTYTVLPHVRVCGAADRGRRGVGPVLAP